MTDQEQRPEAPRSRTESPASRLIEAAEYRPPELQRARLALPGPALVIVVSAVLAISATLWFVLTMRAVEIRIDPEPEKAGLSGLSFRLGGNWLARPGDYTLKARHPGYRELEQDIRVAPDGPARFDLSMEALPGRITITSDPSDAEVRIDGNAIGRTPISDHRLPAGEYELELSSPGFLAQQQRLEVEGLDRAQSIHVELVPGSAEVEIRSEPADAVIRVNGEQLGRTPAVLQLEAGKQQISLHKPGFKSWSESIGIEGGKPLALPLVQLEEAPATIAIESVPAEAEIRIDGQARGSAPLEVQLTPGREARIELSLDGYRTLARTVTPQAGTESTLRGRLVPIDADLQVFAEPAGATLLVDGQPAGRVGPQGLEIQLPAREHELTLRLDGHVSQTRSVRLDPDEPTRVDVQLVTELAARIARVQPLIRSADGQTLKLVEPGRFTMGSERGEQGRRANEMAREVVLSRLFYMGLHEVTNEQFRQFREGHSSGIAGDHTLDNEQQPVVRIGFNDAAAFCNWLSERDGLQPAYRIVNGQYRLIRPVGQGYRLPTEAEWAWVARFAGGRELKYPWGGRMPPDPNAGNFADRSARLIVSPVLSVYDDGAPTSARVGTYDANAPGFHDLGGNVSEWTGDGYENFLNRRPGLQTDPLGPENASSRVVRGSSWRHADITRLRLAWRDQADQGRDDLGFRIVRYAE